MTLPAASPFDHVPTEALDVTARITRLFVYPVKSCAGVEVQEAIMTEAGLEFDRAWMVVDDTGEFVTQRELPRMALIKPQLKHYDMVLRAPGMLALHIALDGVEGPATVRLWGEDVHAFDMGAIAAQWFSDFLGLKLRLVRFDPDHKRMSSKEWTNGVEALNQFNDGFAVLVTSEASLQGLNTRLEAAGQAAVTMERFRPNIVLSGLDAHDEDRLDVMQITGDPPGAPVIRLRPVKPCPRCPIPNVDPATGVSSPQVGDALQAYRKNEVVGGAVTFGMNAIVQGGVDEVVRVGQVVSANWRFD
ncbi:MAG: MOSC N-terminal beta barrel domain-containing protein [Bdellovibrionales bacterium]|nr:MOSC N-terminal beta barrel domain-containing protein [Ramlibacter sp.]